MPESELPLSWRQAALRLEATLRQLVGQPPERLDRSIIESCYPTRRWVAAWRVSVTFSDGVTRRIDVVATEWFPIVPVRTALVDHPEFMTWPHVESDGILCLLPNMAECDPDDPAAVAVNLLDRSIRLTEELIEGTIVERDFREEFLTYWAYKAHADGAGLFSLLKPEPPSRIVKVWRGEGIEVVGEDIASLSQWVRHRFGPSANTKINDAAFLWLDEPLLPSCYPTTASDLRALAAALGDNAVEVLDQTVVSGPDWLITLLGAHGRGGAGLIGVKAPNPKCLKAHPRAATDPLYKGFRSKRTPKPILLDRFFGPSPVVRTSVQRADAAWIHGRGRDQRTAQLLGATVVLIGCGSVGAPIACTLAQAGVGKLVLVDHDALSWANVGRHPLGATAVGCNKAEALAKRLGTDFPHLTIESHTCGLQTLLLIEPEVLASADLIIAATGSWSAENALNRWHGDQGRKQPIMYGWTEAHACAGHGVVIARKGGCLQCHIGRTGAPVFRAVDWPDGADTSQEEPACGAHYQPYGPVELAHVHSMLVELALDCLLNPPATSLHRVFIASSHRLATLGGRRSDAWLAEQGEGKSASQTIERSWPSAACNACGEPAAEETG